VKEGKKDIGGSEDFVGKGIVNHQKRKEKSNPGKGLYTLSKSIYGVWGKDGGGPRERTAPSLSKKRS